MTAPANIKAAVAAAAQQYGVPEALWEDIAFTESGYNVNAIGDNGTSFGLFQLHIGGQADAALAAGYSTQDLLNPTINAQFAMPAIGSAWNNLKSSFGTLGSTQWWQQFAAQSGHPGGAPGEATTDAEAHTLQLDYAVNLIGTPAAPLAPPIKVASCDWTNPSTYTQCFQPIVQIQTDLSYVQDNGKTWAIRVGLFLLAITLLIAGFFVVVKQ